MGVVPSGESRLYGYAVGRRCRWPEMQLGHLRFLLSGPQDRAHLFHVKHVDGPECFPIRGWVDRFGLGWTGLGWTTWRQCLGSRDASMPLGERSSTGFANASRDRRGTAFRHHCIPEPECGIDRHTPRCSLRPRLPCHCWTFTWPTAGAGVFHVKRTPRNSAVPCRTAEVEPANRALASRCRV